MACPIAIVITDPSLVVLVGAAGSGKSTFAARHFARDEVLSSDEFRGRIAGDPGEQRATPAAFAALHRDLERRLRAGLTTVVDATNVTAKARRVLLLRAAAAGMPAVAIVLDLPGATVRARNAARGSAAVPDAAVRRHLAELRAALRDGALPAEGFALVIRLADPASVDAAGITRQPAG